MSNARLSMNEFCTIVRQEIEQLPEQFREKLENVAVDVEARPNTARLRRQGLDPNDWPHILGDFEGRPLTEQAYGERHPNRITLYKDSIEALSRNQAEISYEIRRTLIHELAHHFGFSEQDLEDFESKPSPFDVV